MKSKFTWWICLLATLTLAISIVVVFGFANRLFNQTLPLTVNVLFNLFFDFTWIWLVFGELRTKAITITVENNSLTIRRYLGLGPSKNYYFDQIDGYQTSIETSRAGNYEYTFLLTNNKKVIKLSAYYHRNYADLKRVMMAQQLKNMGFSRYSFIQEMKEIFK